jgi:hypothetical protein
MANEGLLSHYAWQMPADRAHEMSARAVFMNSPHVADHRNVDT